MRKAENTLSEKELADVKARRLVAAHLQTIEDSPPTAEQSAMFEMFERERWPHEQRLAYIRERAEAAAMVHAAE
jgi:hypothetical protein